MHQACRQKMDPIIPVQFWWNFFNVFLSATALSSASFIKIHRVGAEIQPVKIESRGHVYLSRRIYSALYGIYFAAVTSVICEATWAVPGFSYIVNLLAQEMENWVIVCSLKEILALFLEWTDSRLDWAPGWVNQGSGQTRNHNTDENRAVCSWRLISWISQLMRGSRWKTQMLNTWEASQAAHFTSMWWAACGHCIWYICMVLCPREVPSQSENRTKFPDNQRYHDHFVELTMTFVNFLEMAITCLNKEKMTSDAADSWYNLDWFI